MHFIEQEISTILQENRAKRVYNPNLAFRQRKGRLLQFVREKMLPQDCHVKVEYG